MSGAWPVESAFEEVDLKAAAPSDPVICSIAKGARGVNCNLSLSIAFCADHGMKYGARFKVSVAETPSAFYIKLTPNDLGGAQITAGPGKAKNGRPSRQMIRLGRCGGVDLPHLPKQAVDHHAERAPLDRAFTDTGAVDYRLIALTIRVPKGGTKAEKLDRQYRQANAPVAGSAGPCPKDSPAAQAVRRHARAGRLTLEQIAAKVSEDQNVSIDASFVEAAVTAGLE